MATYIVGFDGKWQEKFDDREDAVDWAQDVAATGRTVEVVQRRFGLYSFVTAFPESESACLEKRRGGYFAFDFLMFGGGGGMGGPC